MTENISYIGKAGDDPDNVLRQCVGEFEEVIVIGRLKDGTLELRSSMPELEKLCGI